MSSVKYGSVLDQLLAADVLRETNTGTPVVSGEFERLRGTVAGQSDEEWERIRSVAASATLGVVEPKLVDTAAAAASTIHPRPDPEEALVVGRTIRRIEVSRRIDGVPDGFVAVGADELPAFLNAHPAALVFCWREGSDPTSALRRELATLVADGVVPGDFGLGAVYGPTNTVRLANEYDVTVSPTLLFCVQGRVDCRLVGRHDTDTMVTEVRKLAELRDRQ